MKIENLTNRGHPYEALTNSIWHNHFQTFKGNTYKNTFVKEGNLDFELTLN